MLFCEKKNFQGQAICTEGQSLFEEERESYAFTQYPRPTTYPSPDSDQPHEANFMGYSVVSEHFRLTNWFKFDHAVSVSTSIYYYTGCLREKYTILLQIYVIKVCTLRIFVLPIHFLVH